MVWLHVKNTLFAGRINAVFKLAGYRFAGDKDILHKNKQLQYECSEAEEVLNTIFMMQIYNCDRFWACECH